MDIYIYTYIHIYIYIYIYIFTYIPSHTNIHVYNISHFPCIGGVRDGDGSVSVGRGSGASFAVCICISTRCSAWCWDSKKLNMRTHTTHSGRGTGRWRKVQAHQLSLFGKNICMHVCAHGHVRWRSLSFTHTHMNVSGGFTQMWARFWRGPKKKRYSLMQLNVDATTFPFPTTTTKNNCSWIRGTGGERVLSLSKQSAYWVHGRVPLLNALSLSP